MDRWRRAHAGQQVGAPAADRAGVRTAARPAAVAGPAVALAVVALAVAAPTEVVLGVAAPEARVLGALEAPPAGIAVAAQEAQLDRLSAVTGLRAAPAARPVPAAGPAVASDEGRRVVG